VIVRNTALVLAALSLAACSSDPAAPADAGTPPADTGLTDAGPADTGPTDTGPTDTGPTDTGPADTGPVVRRCNVNGGDSCFELPTVPVMANPGMGMAPVAPNFDCDLPAVTTATAAVTIAGRVDDFQTDAPVANATVDVFSGLNYLGAPVATGMTNALGAYTVTVPAGTMGPLSWRVRATETLDTYLVNDTVDLTRAAITGSNRNSVTQTTAGLLTALLGQTRRDGTGIVAGEALDCQRRDLIGAIATISTTSSRGTNARPTFVADAQVYYFSATSGLPTSRNAATMTNVTSLNGLYLSIQIPPSSTATYYAQVWGFRTQAAVAMGAAGLSLLSEVPVRVLPDVLVTVNQQPLRTP
jgi:hypothetical protein